MDKTLDLVERMKKLSERLMQMAQDRQDWADHPEIGGKKPMLNSHLRGKRYGYSHAAQLIAAARPAETRDWSEFEDEISDAISDSMDMDWSARDGAKAVVAYLKQIGAKLP